jgi:hypothetical protein
MFSKISRYRNVPVVTAPDATGRELAAVDIRLLPDVTGDFRHTVDGGDRLDQLAYKYYNQPLQWWNIADGNPDFLSPLDLLDKGVVVTTQFPVSVAGTPPWQAVFQSLLGRLGVEDVQAIENIQLIPKQVDAGGGQKVTIMDQQFSRAVLVTYNRMNVNADTLATLIATAGFTVAPFIELGQLGQDIVIPLTPTG